MAGGGHLVAGEGAGDGPALLQARARVGSVARQHRPRRQRAFVQPRLLARGAVVGDGAVAAAGGGVARAVHRASVRTPAHCVRACACACRPTPQPRVILLSASHQRMKMAFRALLNAS